MKNFFSRSIAVNAQWILVSLNMARGTGIFLFANRNAII
jgi:hypothetical protein